MDVGLLVGILWIFGQVALVVGVLYGTVRVAVGHALRAHHKRELSIAERNVTQG